MIEISVPIILQVYELSEDGHLIEFHRGEPTDYTFEFADGEMPGDDAILNAEMTLRIGEEDCILGLKFRAGELYELERSQEAQPFDSFIVRPLKLAKRVQDGSGGTLHVFEPIGGARGAWFNIVRDFKKEAKPAADQRTRRNGTAKATVSYDPKADRRGLPAEWLPRKSNPSGGPPPLRAVKGDDDLIESLQATQ
jgi:hypothetical protein